MSFVFLLQQWLHFFPCRYIHFACFWVEVTNAQWLNGCFRDVWYNTELKRLDLWRLHVGHCYFRTPCPFDAVNILPLQVWILDKCMTHRGKFLFVHAMSQLYTGQRDSFLAEMKIVAEKYSKDEIAEMASAIVKGVQEGRLLTSDKWDSSSIWASHSLADSGEGGEADTLVADPLVPYVFVLAYPTGELDENLLLFEMARYNFTSFMARNFDMEIVKGGTITQLRVSGFQSYDEVHAYAQNLYGDAHMRERLEGIRAILISEANLKLLGTRYSYDEYAEFYDAELSPIELPDEMYLDEPTDNGPVDIDDVPLSEESNENAAEEKKDEEEDDSEEDDEDDWLF